MIHEELDQALQVQLKFMQGIRHELKQLFGNVGTNPSMQALLPSAALAWDWTSLVHNRPRPEQSAAFLRVCKAIHPLLRHPEWPEDPEYAGTHNGKAADHVPHTACFAALVDRVPHVFHCVAVHTASLRVWLDCVLRLPISSWTSRFTSLSTYYVRRPRAASFYWSLTAYRVFRTWP